MPVLDLLHREISVGNHVVHYNHVYEVLEIPARLNRDFMDIKMILIDKSATTRPVKKYSKEVCIIPSDDVLVWKIKRGR